MDLGASVRKLTLGALAASSLFVGVGATPVEAQNKKPNVIMLMSDDVGWGDYGVYFGGAPVARRAAPRS